MHSDVLASQMFTATGNLKTVDGANDIGACRLKGVYYSASVAGSLTFRDGGATGTVICTVPVGATTDFIPFPDNGVWARSGAPHVTVTAATVTGATVFYA